MTAEPTTMAPMTIPTTTAIIATATTVAEPCSRSGFARSHRLSGDEEAQRQRRLRADPRDDEVTVVAQLQDRTRRTDATRRFGRGALVTPRGESGRLPGRVNAAHLHRHRGGAPKADDEHHGQRRDGEGRLDRGPSRGSPQTLVFNAFAMMLVSAFTIESPVTTVYRMAPKAAAAIVPITYSVVSDYTLDFGGRSIRLSVTSVAGRLLCGQRPRDYKDDDLADLASHTHEAVG